VSAPDDAVDLARVASVIAQAQIAVDEVALRRPTLDDAFLALTGSPAHTETETEIETEKEATFA
jgi:hypothetical protein